MIIGPLAQMPGSDLGFTTGESGATANVARAEGDFLIGDSARDGFQLGDELLVVVDGRLEAPFLPASIKGHADNGWVGIHLMEQVEQPEHMGRVLPDPEER